MESYRITGKKPLSGSIRASGNKNAALPCLAAALLTDEAVVLRNIPDIEDVHVMISLLRALGAEISPAGDGEQGTARAFRIKRTAVSSEVPREQGESIRASILAAAPLLALNGCAQLPPPGGDVIGHRRLDTHFLVVRAFGGRAALLENGDLRISMEKAAEGEISVFLDEASVTATENAVMLAAASKPGTVTVIQHAACEPHVQDLCGMLTAMGAEIEGIGSNLLTVHGAGGVLRGCDFTIGSDYMEIGSFIGLAAATGGEVTVHGIERRYMPMMELGFARLGISWEYDAGGTVLHVPAGQRRKIVPDVGGMIPHIDDGPWPGFPSDLMSILAVAATQSEGTLLIHEKMFESRMFFIDMLIRMGARIVLCDPHRAVISGPSRLRGQRVDSPDVRAGMALVIAALCAEGTSEIRNIYQIERGYEHLCEKLVSLGADISRDSAGT